MTPKGSILKNKYLTEIIEIDEQHHQIASLLEDLCHLVVESHIENRLDHRINERLSDIVVATRDHFNTEQALMRRHNYAKFDDHCEEHATLLKQIIFMKECCETDDMVLSYRSVRHLIDEWFLRHILEMDKALGCYLLSKGVS